MIRSKNTKQQQSQIEAKRKRSEKESEEKTTNSDAADAQEEARSEQHKKPKQKHDAGTDASEIEAFLAMSGRKTRSQVRNFAATANEVPQSSPEPTPSPTTETNNDPSSDQDYEVEGEDATANESVQDGDAICKICNFGGRLVQCQGNDCDVFVHRGCMFGGNSRPVDHPWYCGKCSRENRAQQRHGKQRL